MERVKFEQHLIIQSVSSSSVHFLTYIVLLWKLDLVPWVATNDLCDSIKIDPLGNISEY